ncbi:MAG TPA: hypothetical protein VKV73_08860 [Chloroflexota bacterium]|nr:hypothetical protein [Chloroflexota bacterium]
MREYVELLVLADHACTDSRPERIEVYEPIGMEMLWVTIFRCCSQVFSEPSARPEAPPVWRPIAVQEAAA